MPSSARDCPAKLSVFSPQTNGSGRPAKDWMKRIKSELSSASFVVLMLSPQSLKRHWVHLEAGAAWIMDRPIIPALYSGLKINEVPRPYSDGSSIDLESGAYHLLGTLGLAVPLSPFHPAFAKLEQELARNLDRISKLK
jgi:hypothetical protein